MFATSEILGLAEWIIDDTPVLSLYILNKMLLKNVITI